MGRGKQEQRGKKRGEKFNVSYGTIWVRTVAREVNCGKSTKYRPKGEKKRPWGSTQGAKIQPLPAAHQKVKTVPPGTKSKQKNSLSGKKLTVSRKGEGWEKSLVSGRGSGSVNA